MINGNNVNSFKLFLRLDRDQNLMNVLNESIINQISKIVNDNDNDLLNSKYYDSDNIFKLKIYIP